MQCWGHWAWVLWREHVPCKEQSSFTSSELLLCWGNIFYIAGDLLEKVEEGEGVGGGRGGKEEGAGNLVFHVNLLILYVDNYFNILNNLRQHCED